MKLNAVLQYQRASRSLLRQVYVEAFVGALGAHVGLKLTQVVSCWLMLAQVGLKLAQVGLKLAQVGPKLGPSWLSKSITIIMKIIGKLLKNQ